VYARSVAPAKGDTERQLVEVEMTHGPVELRA
jgi:hypothetical protein